MRGRGLLVRRLLSGRLAAGVMILSWLSGLALPVVLCDSGEGHLAYEIAFEACCPSAPPAPSALPEIAPREDCAGCMDRELSFLGTLSRPPWAPRPASAGLAVVPTAPPAPASGDPDGFRALRIRSASPPGILARVRLPLLC